MNPMAQVSDLVNPARQVRVQEHARRRPPGTAQQEAMLRSAVQTARNLFHTAINSSKLPRDLIHSLLAAAVKKTDHLLFSKHVKTHDRGFGCEIPGCTSGGFYRLQDVKRHMLSHKNVGESTKYFCTIQDCEYATKGFPREDNCKRHIREQHQGYLRHDLD